MKDSKREVLFPSRRISASAELGESPLWDPRTNELWFTDIASKRLGRIAEGHQSVQWFGCERRITAIGLTARPGRFVAATDIGIATIEVSNTVVIKQLITQYSESGGIRMNDGRVHPSGEFWVGSMVEDLSRSGGKLGDLFRFRGGNLESMGLSVNISNSLCWLDGGNTTVFADSPSGEVNLFRTEGAGIELSALFYRARAGVHPDGACVDREGRVWLAKWGASEVVVLSRSTGQPPFGKFAAAVSGQVAMRLRVPCPQVTCVAFGGADLSTVFVTTAKMGMSQAELRRHPFAGDIFVYETPALGLAEPICTELD